MTFPVWESNQVAAAPHSAGVSSRTITKPVGTAEGDWLVLNCMWYQSPGVVTPPTDFTLVRATDGGTFTVFMQTFVKQATGSEPADYTVSWANNRGCVCTISRVTGSSGVLTDSGASGGTVLADSMTAAAVTLDGEDNLLLLFGGWRDQRGSAAVAPMTEVFDTNITNLGGPDLIIATEDNSAAGSTGTRTIDATDGTSSRWTAQIIAFAPALTAGSGDLVIEGVGDVEMTGAGEATGQLELEGVGDVAMEGHMRGSLTLTAVGDVAMEGEQVGPVSQVLTPFAIRAGADLRVSLTVDSVGGELELPPEPEEEPEPSTVRRASSKVWIYRIQRTVPDVSPFLDSRDRVNVEEWTEAHPNPVYSLWGRYKIDVGGRDVTFYRNTPSEVVRYSKAEPFGFLAASLRFPQIHPWSSIPGWIYDGAPVDIWQVQPDGTKQKVWEGITGPVRSAVTSSAEGLVVDCIGVFYQLDMYLRRALLVEDTIPNDIGIILQDLISKWGRDKRALRMATLNRVITGVEVRSRGDWQPQATGYISDLLRQAQLDDGSQYTIRVEFGRKPKLLLKDTTTQHYSIHLGEQGVEHDLVLDWTLAPTTIYGEGTFEECRWYNAKYPNLRYGSAPVFFGDPIEPGDTDKQDSFLLFETHMVNLGWTGFDKDGNYDLSEEFWVRKFQEEAGVTVDGVVGPQTWAAAFLDTDDGSNMKHAYIESLYSLRVTELWNHAPDGSKTTKNPLFNAKVPRVERYENFGDRVSKKEAMRSSKLEVQRDYPATWMGTITLKMDPPEVSRLEIREGRNILVRSLQGEDILMHIAQVDVEGASTDNPTARLTVDERGRDYMTLAQMLTRNRESKDPGRRRERHYRNRSRQINDQRPVWDCENGAGIIPEHAVTPGSWSVVRVAGAKLGTMVRAEVFTREPALAAIGIFDRPVTAAQLARIGTGNPFAHPDYWETFPDPLNLDDPRHEGPSPNGLIIGWGSVEEPGGLWPYRLEDNKPVTGVSVDAGTWYYESENPPWLWAAIYVGGPNLVGPSGELLYPDAPSSNYVVGRLYPSNETT